MKLCIRVLRSESGGYIASCPSLPGCRCQGQTREQATERLNDAIRGYIAAVSNFVPERVDHEVLEV